MESLVALICLKDGLVWRSFIDQSQSEVNLCQCNPGLPWTLNWKLIYDRTNFQLSVESNLGLFLFALFRPVICQKNLASPSRPIKCNPKTSHDSVAHVFLRFRQFGSHDPLWFISLILISCCDYVGFVFTTLNRKALHDTNHTPSARGGSLVVHWGNANFSKCLIFSY